MARFTGFDEVYSALYVDFDNIYTRFLEADPEAARAFGMAPYRWVRWIENHALRILYGDGVRRRILKRMCYLNPQRYQSVFGNSFINNETFQQYACHGYLSHGLRHIKASLVIPHKTPPANQPAECSFNYPTLRHWLKACLPWCAFHDFHNKSKIGGLVHQ